MEDKLSALLQVESPMKENLDVTSFLDYREFLLAHAENQRQRNPRWTFGVWAKRLGLKGTASLTRVLQGQRHPGKEMVERLVGYFAFDEARAEYFRDLVRLHKVRSDPRLSLILIEKMGKNQPESAIRRLDEHTLQAFQTISSWFWPVVREMTHLRDFRHDPKWISERMTFEVPPRDVATVIDNLLNLGLLSLDAHGKLIPSGERLNTQPDVASEAVKRYHEEMLARAAESLRTVSLDKREITAQCFVIREDRLSEAKELIREFQDRFVKLLETSDGNAVYQLQLQFFPVARTDS